MDMPETVDIHRRDPLWNVGIHGESDTRMSRPGGSNGGSRPMTVRCWADEVDSIH